MRPNYTLRRIVAGIVAILIGWVIVESTDHYYGSRNYSCDVETVIVRNGDNLWNLAHHHCNGDASRVAELLADEYGSLIYPSQVITFPTDSR